MNHKFYNYRIFGEETTRLLHSFAPLFTCLFQLHLRHGWSIWSWEILGLQPNALGKSGSAKASGDPSSMWSEIWNITRCRNDLTMLFPAKSMAIHAYPWLSAKSLLFVFQTAANWQNAELIRKNTGFVPHFSGPVLAPHGAPRLTTRRVGRCYNVIIENVVTAWQWDSFKFQSRLCCKLHHWVVSQRLRLFNSNDSDW